MLRIAGAGSEQEGELRVDEYIPLSLEWPRRPGCTLWWMFSGPRTLLQTGFDPDSGDLVDVTLVLPGPIAVVEHGPSPAAPRTVRGAPRVDPEEWHRRAASGSVKEFADRYVHDPLPVRTELGPAHLLVRIGDDDEAAAFETVCGRLRAGLSAEQALLWFCIDGFSPEERALLHEHAERSLAPPTISPPTPPSRAGWFSRLAARVLKRR